MLIFIKSKLNHGIMDIDVLKDLGFTHAEGAVYLALLKLGPVRVGRIIEKTGLQSSTTHNTLNTLTDKGFVTHVLEGKVKVYQSVKPRAILDEFRDRQQQFETILPKLEAMTKEERPSAEVYQGIKGITTMLNELIQDAKGNYYFYAADVPKLTKEITTFFARRDAKRKEQGLNVQGLARKDLKSLFKGRKHMKMRYVDYPLATNVNLCNNKMAIISWTERPTGILITSPQVVSAQIKQFKQLWDEANDQQ